MNNYETYQAVGQLIFVEVYDEDMAETIWPFGNQPDEGFWVNKEQADQRTDDSIGRYFVNKFLLDYGNTFTYTVTRGRTEIRNFKRRIGTNK